jgi:hypothetical protein
MQTHFVKFALVFKTLLYFTGELAINPLLPIEKRLCNNSFPGSAFVRQILRSRAHKGWKKIQSYLSSTNLLQGHIS